MNTLAPHSPDKHSPDSSVADARSRFNRVIERAAEDFGEQRRIFNAMDHDDARLLPLTLYLDIAGRAAWEQSRSGQRAALTTLIAYCLAWLSPRPTAVFESIERVWLERERQRELIAAGRISFDCADPAVPAQRKFRVLTEEIGEVAHAIDQIENHGMAEGNRNLELTHVAAVACAWLEALSQGNVRQGNGGGR